jgi:Alginate lyase
MQVAVFAHYVGRDDLTVSCRNRYKSVLLPNQVAADGSFPEELRRTKPFGYSLFNLDAMAMVCQVLSTAADNLWTYELPDARGMRKAVAFLFPFIADKRKWPHKPDVMYHDEWPMRHPSLLFAGRAFAEPAYLDLWQRLPADSEVEEVIRNFFVRQPLLWG